jgi:hypothetical protein
MFVKKFSIKALQNSFVIIIVPEQIGALAAKFCKAFNRNDAAAVAAFCTEDVVYRSSKQRWEHITKIRKHYGYSDMTEPAVGFRLTRWPHTVCAGPIGRIVLNARGETRYVSLYQKWEEL